MNRDELREKIAKLEHEQWSHWLVYMLNILLPQNINRWKRQAETPFEKLSEKEKDSDRVWADKVLSLIEGELDKAKKYDALFPLIKRIATVSYNQVNGGEGLLTAREVWEWQAEAERILYGKVGGCRDALEGKEAKDEG